MLIRLFVNFLLRSWAQIHIAVRTSFSSWGSTGMACLSVGLEIIDHVRFPKHTIWGNFPD